MPARQVRARRYGMANQLAYEADERAERAATVQRLADSRTAAQRKGAKKVKGELGANAGTVGGAWLANFKR